MFCGGRVGSSAKLTRNISFARKTCGARERCSRFLGQELERKKKFKRRSTMLSTGKASVFRTASSDRARLRMFAQDPGDVISSQL